MCVCVENDAEIFLLVLSTVSLSTFLTDDSESA